MTEEKKAAKPKLVECVLLKAIGTKSGTLKKGSNYTCSEVEYNKLKKIKAV